MIKHRYAHEIDPNGGSAAARLARLVAPGQRVLELGTGPGTVTRILHSKGCKVTGVEMDPETLAMCAPFCERSLQANLEDPQWHASLAGEKFDVVMCADVLEHLRDPRPLLSLLQQFLNDTGCVLMSLPNATHLSVVASLMVGRFPYQSKGLLDNTHLRFFGRDDIDSLLRECGLVWQRWETVQPEPAQAELSHYWNQLEAADQEFLRAKCADGLVYQHVVRSYPSHAAGQLLKLEKDLEDQKSSLLLEMESLRQDHAQATLAWGDEKNALNQQMAQLQAQLQSTQHELHGAQGELQSSQGVLENTQATLNWTQEQLQNHRHSLDEVLQSASWKVTKPLRALGIK
jgi:2-polyprenyl-3-methyl-5-hydroxy-6-metoxy-1,4-benzoquinol methylase/predicted  nucleic acid-binding Zn-ribbon protein